LSIIFLLVLYQLLWNTYLKKDYQKILQQVDESPVECAGVFKVQILPTKDRKIHLYIHDYALLPQRGRQALIHVNDEHFSRWVLTEFEKGEQRNCGWWHSHVHFATTPSLTDETTIDGLTKMGGFVVSLIFNKRSEHYARVDYNLPNGAPLAVRGEIVINYPDFMTKAEQEAASQELHMNLSQRNSEGNWWEDDAVEDLERLSKSSSSPRIKAAHEEALKEEKKEQKKNKRKWKCAKDDGPHYKNSAFIESKSTRKRLAEVYMGKIERGEPITKTLKEAGEECCFVCGVVLFPKEIEVGRNLCNQCPTVHNIKFVE